jgi:hypothetical protein
VASHQSVVYNLSRQYAPTNCIYFVGKTPTVKLKYFYLFFCFCRKAKTFLLMKLFFTKEKFLGLVGIPPRCCSGSPSLSFGREPSASRDSA